MTNCVTGSNIVFNEKLVFNDGLDVYRLSSKEISDKIKELNADCVYAF